MLYIKLTGTMDHGRDTILVTKSVEVVIKQVPDYAIIQFQNTVEKHAQNSARQLGQGYATQ